MRADYQKITPRCPIASLNFFSDRFKSATAGAEFAMAVLPEIYAEGIARVRGKFTADELRDIIQRVGHKIPITMIGKALMTLAPTDKVKSLDISERIALEIWALRYWVEQPEIEQYLTEMAEKSN